MNRRIEGAIVISITWAGFGIIAGLMAAALWATSFLNL